MGNENETFLALNLVDPYTVDANELALFLKRSQEFDELRLKRRLAVPAYKSMPVLKNLPSRLEITARIKDLDGKARRTGQNTWYANIERLKFKYKKTQIEIHGPENNFTFTFPRNAIQDAQADLFDWLYTLELGMKTLIECESNLACASNFQNWFVGNAYLRLMKFSSDHKEGRILCLANLSMIGPYIGQGLGKFLFACLQEVALRVGVPLEFENTQPRLSAHLHRLGWLRRNNSPTCHSWIDPVTVSIGSAMSRHLIEAWGPAVNS